MENQLPIYAIVFIGGIVAAFGILWAMRVFARRQRNERTNRILIEDVLKHFYQCETEQEIPIAQSVAGVLRVTVGEATKVMTEMQRYGLIANIKNNWQLTEQGRNYALQVIRAHRLWERYLADRTGFPESQWHEISDRQEHQLSPDETNALAAKLGHPRYDPHGDPIPTADGTLAAPVRHPLTTFPVGQAAQVVHLEDEPLAIYQQLGAKDIHLRTIFRLIERTPAGVTVLMPSRKKIILNSAQAANVSVVPAMEEDMSRPEPSIPLSNLKPGDAGRVINISPAARGVERRRMMDLGIVPGTIIKAEMVSPGGDPTAYLIRGALIALRREQAVKINVSRTLKKVSAEEHADMEVFA